MGKCLSSITCLLWPVGFNDDDDDLYAVVGLPFLLTPSLSTQYSEETIFLTSCGRRGIGPPD